MTTAAEPTYWMEPIPIPVAAVVRETSETVTFALDVGRDSPLAGCRPGQFNMIYAFGIGEAPISISGGADGSGHILHTVRRVGAVSRALTKVNVGDMVGVRGPFGQGWPVDRLDGPGGRDLVLVAGGIGLAPLRPVLLHALTLRRRFGRILVIYGARSPDDMIYRDDIAGWQERADLDLAVTVDYATETWRGRVGFVTALIPQARFDPARTAAMLCGPEVMMRASATALMRRGVRPESIHLSLERNMKCAIAQCGHCQFGESFVCRDGPVFAYPCIRARMQIREI